MPQLQHIPNLIYTDTHFSLNINQDPSETRMVMKVHSPIINTRYLPLTHRILKSKLPTILSSTCFNEENRPFRLECKRTEVGHLFEHILLEYLCLIKREQGNNNPLHNGLTEWNWTKDATGTFYITVDSGKNDGVIFFEALQKSIFLIKTVLISQQTLQN